MSNRALIGVVGFIGGFGILAGLTYLSMNHDLNTLKEGLEPVVIVTTLGNDCPEDKETAKVDRTGVTCKTDVILSQNSKYNDKNLPEGTVEEIETLIEESALDYIPGFDLKGCENISLSQDITITFPTKYEQPFRLCEIPNWQSYPLLLEIAELHNKYHI